MGIIDQKNKIFGNIGAARTLSEGLPKLVTNPSFPSINNDGDSIAFLTDMLKSLVGIDKLRDVIVDTLGPNLDKMEDDIKAAIKLSLKTLVNCGVDPSIPSFIKSSGSGVLIEVNKVDFFNVMKTDPKSEMGKLLYTDTTPTPLTNSNDFNTFLYGTIQNEAVVENWGTAPKILNIRFDSVNGGTTPNNTLTFNANSDFDNKTLTELNNTYVDSVDLFDSTTLLNKILDNLFGSLSVKLNKTTEQLKKEAEIETIIDCIINADKDDVIDDSFFTFSNEQVSKQEEVSNLRKRGIMPISTCDNQPVSVPINTINFVNEQISGKTGQDKQQAISESLTVLGVSVADQAADPKNSYALELNFIERLIQSLVTSMVSFLLSPKIITIFLLNYKIVYGVNEEYVDAADFMKQNKNLIKDIAKSVRDSIISVLLNTVLKEVSSLVGKTAITIATEKSKNQLTQTLSLLGIPQEVLRLIKGL